MAYKIKTRYETKVSPRNLMKLLDLIDSGVITRTTAKKVFEQMFNTGQAPDEIVFAPLDKSINID